MPKKIKHKNQPSTVDSKQKLIENQVDGILNPKGVPSAHYLTREKKKEENKVKRKLINEKIKELEQTYAAKLQEDLKKVKWGDLKTLKETNKTILQKTIKFITDQNDARLKYDIKQVEGTLLHLNYANNKEISNLQKLLKDALNVKDNYLYSNYFEKIRELQKIEREKLISSPEFQKLVQLEIKKITEESNHKTVEYLRVVESKILNNFKEDEEDLFSSLQAKVKSYKNLAYGSKLREFKNSLNSQENKEGLPIIVGKGGIRAAIDYYDMQAAQTKTLEQELHNTIVDINANNEYLPIILAYQNIDTNKENINFARVHLKKTINLAGFYSCLGYSKLHIQDTENNYEIIKLIDYINDSLPSKQKHAKSETTGADYFDRLIGSYFIRKHVIGDKEEELYKALKNNITKFIKVNGALATEKGILTEMDIALLTNDKDLAQKLINEIDFKNKSHLEIKTYFRALEFSKDYLKLQLKYDNIAYNENDIGDLKIPLSYTDKKELNADTFGYYELQDNGAEVNTTQVNIADLNKIVYGYRHHSREIKKVHLVFIERGKESWNSKTHSKYFKELFKIDKTTDLTIIIGNGEGQLDVDSFPEIVKDIKLLYPNLNESFVQIIAHGSKKSPKYSKTIMEIFDQDNPLATKIHIYMNSCYSGQYDEALLPDAENIIGFNKNYEFILTTASDANNPSYSSDLNTQQLLDFFKKYPDGNSFDDFIKFINSGTVRSVPQISYIKNGIRYDQTTIKEYCEKNNELANEEGMIAFTQLFSNAEKEYEAANNNDELKKQVAKVVTTNLGELGIDSHMDTASLVDEFANLSGVVIETL